MEREIILVDVNDRPVGTATKEDAHRRGDLHRAFSVFLYCGDRLLIQQRAFHKYHSGGLWANTCCSHPRPGEELEEAVSRRLKEEAGIECEVKEIFSFVYKHRFAEDLYEHEYDHVFLGEYCGDPVPNPEEIEAFRWIFFGDLKRELAEEPEKFAPWFVIAAPRVLRVIGDGSF
jgi:isopentenyl-diphosphate delta-isomerase